MILTIYQALVDEQRTPAETDTIRWLPAPPTTDDCLSIGDHRSWEVCQVETYSDGLDEVYLATIYPQGGDTMEAGKGTIHALKQFSQSLSYYVQLSPSLEVLGHGWRMNGDAPIGRLTAARPTTHPTLLETVELPWMVDLIDTYTPDDGVSYSAIHVCRCLPVSQSALILV